MGYAAKNLQGASKNNVRLKEKKSESSNLQVHIKFMFSRKATKIDKIFTVDLTLCSKCQIDGEDFVNFFVAFFETINFNKNNSRL